MDLKHAAHLDLGFGDVLFLHGHKVTVKNHEISVFPDFNAAFAAFKETAFGHPDGDGTKGLFSGEGVFHLEALGGCAVQMLAGNGGIESVNRADVFNGEVSAVNHPAVLLQQLLISVGILDAFAKTLVGPIHVGGAVGGLDGGNDRIFTITLEISLVYSLRVLNAPAEVVLAFEVLGVDVEDVTHAAVTNGMATF